MHKFIPLILYILVSVAENPLSAQTPDSLYAIWQDTSLSDSLRVKAFNDYLWSGFLFANPDNAVVLAEELIRYSEEHHYPQAPGTAHGLQGIANAVRGNYPGSMKSFEKSLAIWEVIGDKTSIANALNNIGKIYQEQGNLPRALEYFERGRVIFEETISGRFIVQGRHEIPTDSHVWILLHDGSSYYLQNPPVMLYQDNTWRQDNCYANGEIQIVMAASVGATGHSKFQEMVKKNMFGNFSDLPDDLVFLDAVTIVNP